MYDPWLDRLSDYVDGLMDEAEARELRKHLETCDDCRAIEADLRTIVQLAHDAQPIEPARDLWPAILGGISASSAPRDIASARSARVARRFSFSMPQLAAAAVLLMAVTGTAVWLISSEEDGAVSGTIVQNAAPEPSYRLVSLEQEPQVTDEIAALQATLEENRSVLDPATVEVVERSLESIDRAIADARAALEADPGNPYLHRQLDNTMRKKVDILRMATRVPRAGT